MHQVVRLFFGGEAGIDSGASMDPRPAGAGIAGVQIGNPADLSNQRVLITTCTPLIIRKPPDGSFFIIGGGESLLRTRL